MKINDVKLCGCFADKCFYDMPFGKVPRFDDAVVKEGLVLALDPSSSQTGIALGTQSGQLLLCMDFINLVLNKKDFTITLNDYLERLGTKLNVTTMVYEVTYDRSGDDMASVVLRDLEYNFNKYSKLIPSLSRENMYPILPSVWRKNFLSSKCYAGKKRSRQSLKDITRKECCIRYPQYQEYFFSYTEPPDSTDAIGVYHGFMDEFWWDQPRGIRNISKANSRYSRNHKYDSMVVAFQAQGVLGMAVSRYGVIDILLYAYNSEYGLEANIEIATAQTNKPCVIFALDAKSSSILQWSVTSGDVNSRESICAVICRRENERGELR